MHPGAWWLWAAALIIAALSTTNVVVLAAVAVICWLVSRWHPPVAVHPWSGRTLLLVIGGIWLSRLVLQIVFGAPIGVTTAFTLPSWESPEPFAGIEIGGPVTWEGLWGATLRSAQIAVVMVVAVSANTRCRVDELVAALPRSVMNLGLSLRVAMRLIPQLSEELARARQGLQLRQVSAISRRGIRHLINYPIRHAAGSAQLLAIQLELRGFNQSPSPTRFGNPAWQRVDTRVAMGALLGTSGVLTWAQLFPNEARPSIAPIAFPQVTWWVLVALALTAAPALVARR